MTAREAALKALYDIETKDTFTNAALKNALNTDLSDNDRGLATELIYGVVLNKTALDYIISRYSKIKLKKMSPWVINILRLGVFQIYYMDKIPHSAACNESVKLANKYSHRAGSGFVNGVLRAFSRESEGFQFPKEKGMAEYFSLKYSYPLWMVEKLLDEYGEERCEALFEENRRSHGVFLRVNTLKNTVEQALVTLENQGISCEKTEVENCLKVTGKINVDLSKAYSDGLFSLQNISSQKTIEILDPKAGETVFDMCAAPGGKSCAIAEKMENRGRVLSFDIFEHKVELIKKSAQRLGIEIVDARLQDAAEDCAELYESADRVLVDAPCSGLGVIHKKPDIKFKRTAEDVEELCRIQKRILSTASKYLKDGGVLVYSTCTILPEENRVQIENFLNEHKEYKKVSEEQILTTERGESGFYICKMVKEKNED
ncbi:MAG: 16S rRNA (cytosine(967)-C(5))-methyltransferase RsmB [Clostridia bacterium]|nr:16S rRNA (cytosine(967)-C(5))-methyltransferase RsmB [Clostridia bacterium]